MKFYIKPQHVHSFYISIISCILLKFYIKPQPAFLSDFKTLVVSYWNSTSNHNSRGIIDMTDAVVSYWNSTSNHNMTTSQDYEGDVVSYWNSTSNHNMKWRTCSKARLYLIEILHQTTTLKVCSCPSYCCILLKFYIKPQPNGVQSVANSVVSYWNSTSNHNRKPAATANWRLYLIEILHQTTTVWVMQALTCKLYLIEILHQTTTHKLMYTGDRLLYLIEILHQTTTRRPHPSCVWCCILLKFYIKPQLFGTYRMPSRKLYLIEILHQTTTVGIVGDSITKLYLIEILHQTTTAYMMRKDAVLVVSYWNSTSNHNVRHWIDWYIALYIKIIIIKKSEFTLWRSRFDVFQYVKEQGKYTENI